MTWVGNITEFAKRLLQLQGRVEKNTEDIKELRQDLKELTEFTRKVAYAVQRNKDKQEGDHKILVLQLENELLKLESRLNRSNHFTAPESNGTLKQLADSNGRIDPRTAERQ